MMSEFDLKNFAEIEELGFDGIAQELCESEDLMMEKILDNINNTPIGQVLKKVAGLPEVRRDKILGVRKQLTKGDYSISERLNLALDKVIDDLTT